MMLGTVEILPVPCGLLARPELAPQAKLLFAAWVHWPGSSRNELFKRIGISPSSGWRMLRELKRHGVTLEGLAGWVNKPS